MKKYLVVAYLGYYPECGLENIRFHSDNWKEANEVYEYYKSIRRWDYIEVVDRDEFEPDVSNMDDYYEHLAKADGWLAPITWGDPWTRANEALPREALIKKYR